MDPESAGDHDQATSAGSRQPKQASSAYSYYIKEQAAKGRAVGAEEGTSGAGMLALYAAKWKELSKEERKVYDDLAAADRARFQRETEARDKEAAEEIERKRIERENTVVDSRMRHTTTTQSQDIQQKSEKRVRRELTEHEKAKRKSIQEVKEREHATIQGAQDELKREKVAQAEARLRYLLSQSDIFKHFGAGKTLSESITPAQAATSSTSSGLASPTKRRASVDDDHAADAEEKEIIDEEEEEGEELGDSSKNKSAMLFKQPDCISFGQMRPYQLEGLNWMIRLQENGINGILADEMGLGKTLQSISVLAYMHEFLGISGPHIVVVPKSTLSNWTNEFRRWCPVLRTVSLHGSKEVRAEKIADVIRPTSRNVDRDWDVLLTTYEVANIEKASLQKIAWRYLIIDEAHRLKNEASQFSVTVRALNTQYRLLLTGTPLQNNLHELWALLNFLLPDVFASAEQFDEWFNLDIDDVEAKQRMIVQLHKILRPFMLRRLKADVESSLPPKSETILFTGLSTMQKQLYKQLLMRDISTINGAASDKSNSSRTAILNIVMQLRKACNHPYLFQGWEDRTLDPLGDHLVRNCGKMVLLDKLLRKLYERGHRVLIFSQMTRMLDILEDFLVMSGYQYCRIDGNTSYEVREDLIDEYNRPGSSKYVFLLSTRAGGLGINLKSADVVILYDSDWNPQMDLQAQDRCHRIGQKKQVHVYRLVTDDTVEVKVVERAQQKLKLDAMVVQQGRLQDKEKKLSKDELLDAVRFGADKIFRAQGTEITDADIDLILEEGRKRTEEMNEKLKTAEKGDLFDFRLDGGMSSQVFEGTDYSKSGKRGPTDFAIPFIDPGKRERKTVISYNENALHRPPSEQKSNENKPLKLPRHLRLPKMEEWQFHNKERLQELQDEEVVLFAELVANGEAPQPGEIRQLVLLEPAKMAEKEKLLQESFGDWSRQHFNNFVKASAKYGRQEYEKIAKEVGKSEAEVTKYATVLWERGPSVISASEWEKVVKAVEKGEKRLEEIARLTEATAKLISMFDNPWEELTFRHVPQQGRIFNAAEDRYLLCLTQLHGYGNWDKVRLSLRRCERFRFDYYLLSSTSDAIGKRCEVLMRQAEKELIELEKKKRSTDGAFGARSKEGGGLAQTDIDKLKRLQELDKQIAEEAKKIAKARADLQKLKQPQEKDAALAAQTNPADLAALLRDERNTFVSAAATARPGKKPGQGVKMVPEILMPELCKIIASAGGDGIGKISQKFLKAHPEISKRQAELKIAEVAFKDKLPSDSVKSWHLKPEFERYLHMDEAAIEAAQAATAAAELDHKPEALPVAASAPSSESKKKKATPMASEKAPSKKARKEADAEVKESAQAKDISKRKRSESESGHGASPEAKVVKPKSAKMWFAVDNKKAVRSQYRITDNDELREKLNSLWEELDEAGRAPYNQKAREDKARYDKAQGIADDAEEEEEEIEPGSPSAGSPQGDFHIPKRKK